MSKVWYLQIVVTKISFIKMMKEIIKMNNNFEWKHKSLPVSYNKKKKKQKLLQG